MHFSTDVVSDDMSHMASSTLTWNADRKNIGDPIYTLLLFICAMELSFDFNCSAAGSLVVPVRHLYDVLGLEDPLELPSVEKDLTCMRLMSDVKVTGSFWIWLGVWTSVIVSLSLFIMTNF